jgi:L-malate glycosyltransferase
MKVLLLGDASSAHIIKWANSIKSKGVDVLVFGLSDFNPSLYNSEIRIETFRIPDFIKWKKDGNFLKSAYILALPKLKSVLKKFKPDLLHTQYASSYGLLASLVNYHPSLLQVWGADVYRFPDKSRIHRSLLEFNLKRADRILSTSYSMTLRTKNFTNKSIDFVYLGVDINKFKPMKVNSLFKTDDIVIGSIKTLEPQYGIEYLIRAFRLVKDKLPELPLKLLIVGQGTLENMLKKLIVDLKLNDDTLFTGQIPYNEVPKYHNMLDIFVALSTEDSETFGVAAVEASACEKPVVVSNVGGLPEAVEDKLSGFIVKNKNIEQAADAIIKLVLDENLRKRMGINGRKRVVENFNWEDKVEQIISLYKNIIQN